VRKQIDDRISEHAAEVQDCLNTCRGEAEGRLDKLARGLRGAQRAVESLRTDLQSLQAELRGTGAEGRKLGQAVSRLAEQVRQLQDDMQTLDLKTDESVRRRVSEAFAEVESTVLSALEAVHEEIVRDVSYGSSPESGPTLPGGHGDMGPAPGNGSRENIITVSPLFEGMGAGAEPEGQEEPEDDEEEPDEG